MTSSSSITTQQHNNQLEEVKDSTSIDLEWVPYKGKYQHDKTKIFAACICTDFGESIVLHISEYPTEKELIQDILFYFNQFPLTFGWYTTGLAVYDDDNTSLRLKGRDSDFFVLHQRCQLYGLKSPFEVKKTYVKLLDNANKKHIDLCSVFGKKIIQDSVFAGKYRTTSLDNVSQALVGIGKYGKLNAGTTDILLSLPVKEQIQYVKRDAELTMLLAQYNNCLALRIMKVFAKYSEMDYYQVCHTNVSHWYANLYKKMLESGRCTVTYTPNYKLPKQEIAGGHHTKPVKGFFVGTKVYELDVSGQYPNIAKYYNFSFDTLNCICCQYNEKARVKQEIIDTINEQHQKNGIDRRVEKYWVCQRLKGAFPAVLEQVLGDRDKYKSLLKQEESSASPNFKLIEEYRTHQLGAKLFANAGAGLFGTQYFDFSNYQVNECITAEGRRIHKQMETMGQAEPYNFKIVFGFTDSTFFTNASDDKIIEFIQDCKDKLKVTVELKNVFVNSIFYNLKNRFVAWTGNGNEAPIIKGLNGLSEFDPLWIRKWFSKILIQIIKQPETRLEAIPSMLKEAFSELDNERFNAEQDLRFTQRLGKYEYQYKKESARACKLAKLLDKEKGDLVYYYKTCTKEGFSIKSENLNLYEYKDFLFEKLKGTLEITGFNYLELKSKLLIENAELILVQSLALQQEQQKQNHNDNFTTGLEGALNDEIIVK